MAAYDTLIDAGALQARLADADLCVFDCRFVLTDPDAGEAAYQSEHIPGARYAHLDRDMSSAAGAGGRHPLPSVEDFLAWARRHGVSSHTQVVVYDDGIGAMAARLWWLFQWVGHGAVAVLDGGLNAWRSGGGALHSGVEAPLGGGQLMQRPSVFETRSLEQVEALVEASDSGLVDARDGVRYRGESEPFAPVAGHIPTARSRPFADNCEASGHFKSVADLGAAFAALGGERLVCYCGSGVTACHNILAAVHAGLPAPALFVGSWSQWVLDTQRPVATG